MQSRIGVNDCLCSLQGLMPERFVLEITVIGDRVVCMQRTGIGVYISCSSL